jgi:hypothetical protein
MYTETQSGHTICGWGNASGYPKTGTKTSYIYLAKGTKLPVVEVSQDTLGQYIVVYSNIPSTTSVNEVPNIQTLLQNNPNPFSDKTEILFNAEEIGSAEFKIYNMIGKVVYKSSLKVERGTNKIEVNAKEFESGIYFYSIVYGGNVLTRKMVVSK